MNIADFYEQYWQREQGSPAEHGYEIGQRRAKLQGALRGLPAGSAVLDAGCGNGEFSAFLKGLGYQVAGIDISATAVGKARRAVSDVPFQAASVEESLPFESARFQAVWCTEVLEHLFNVHGALAELNRVLAPGGLLVLTTPYHGRVKNLLIALAGFERHYNPYLSHIRFYTRPSLTSCLGRAGFEVVEWGGIGRAWPLWMSHFVVARKAGAPGAAPDIIG